tara:strand:- start:869 stop:1045 length:177 start_codon:yes stop_codon:yes gene_type:complete
MKRYVVQVEKYVWAEDDKDVISKMEHECSKEDIKNDNRCSVVQIVEQPFGSIGNRKVV